MQRLAAAQKQPQQAVEADEMIHVGVADKDVADLQDVPRRQCRDLTQVEQKGSLLEQKGQEKAGVFKRRVDQPRVVGGAHAQGR